MIKVVGLVQHSHSITIIIAIITVRIIASTIIIIGISNAGRWNYCIAATIIAIVRIDGRRNMIALGHRMLLLMLLVVLVLVCGRQTGDRHRGDGGGVGSGHRGGITVQNTILMLMMHELTITGHFPSTQNGKDSVWEAASASQHTHTHYSSHHLVGQSDSQTDRRTDGQTDGRSVSVNPRTRHKTNRPFP